ncbi:Gfo/Idh/MocA family oxidoreductase [candidate division KSB1 bacterium]|nr:Gfo/Idh/MocA family oxidoreductase [candidate division KSB1 bacterium]
MRDMKRRTFLKTSTIAAPFFIVPRHVLGGPGYTSPGDKLNIAGIGIGGQGSSDLQEMESENIIALCDVDWEKAAPVFERYPHAKRYHDFREMLDTEKEIDAVVIATPDHTHAIATMTAIVHGKHVFCEKPLTHTLHEARLIARTAKEAGLATQMGNQGMAFEGNRLIKEWLADGAIGTVREVHVWSDRPTHKGTTELYWPQGIEAPTDLPTKPESLDWDLWLGPAAERPYHPAYSHFVWRGWWDFGEGGLGDMGIHNIAPAYDALKLTAPTSVHASSTPAFPQTVPAASIVHYEFPANGDRPPLSLHWYDGGLLPPRPAQLEDERELPKEDGLIFIGDDGAMLVDGWGGASPRLLPESRMQEYAQPPKSLPRSIGHYAEWIKGCKDGTPTMSHFGFAGPLTEVCLLGLLSVRLGGKKLQWDAENMRVTNDAEAIRLLHYDYRAGWSL